jgi:hypothetical protein
MAASGTYATCGPLSPHSPKFDPERIAMSIRFQITALVFMMTIAVAFGIGIVPILIIPVLANHAFEAIPAVVLASIMVSAPLSWFIAPRLRARYWQTQAQRVSPPRP